jgi:hypothetical protein
MADFYAWSTLQVGGKVVDGVVADVKVVKPGEKVTASGLGINETEFAAMCISGAVRTTPFPADLPAGMSPREYFIKQAAQEGLTDQFALTTGGSHMTSDDTLNYSETEATAKAKAEAAAKK